MQLNKGLFILLIFLVIEFSHEFKLKNLLDNLKFSQLDIMKILKNETSGLSKETREEQKVLSHKMRKEDVESFQIYLNSFINVLKNFNLTHSFVINDDLKKSLNLKLSSNGGEKIAKKFKKTNSTTSVNSSHIANFKHNSSNYHSINTARKKVNDERNKSHHNHNKFPRVSESSNFTNSSHKHNSSEGRGLKDIDNSKLYGELNSTDKINKTNNKLKGSRNLTLKNKTMNVSYYDSNASALIQHHNEADTTSNTTKHVYRKNYNNSSKARNRSNVEDRKREHSYNSTKRNITDKRDLSSKKAEHIEVTTKEKNIKESIDANQNSTKNEISSRPSMPSIQEKKNSKSINTTTQLKNKKNTKKIHTYKYNEDELRDQDHPYHSSQNYHTKQQHPKETSTENLDLIYKKIKERELSDGYILYSNRQSEDLANSSNLYGKIINISISLIVFGLLMGVLIGVMIVVYLNSS